MGLPIKKSVLLVVGHSPFSPGARNLGPTSAPGDDLYEFQFNLPLVERIAMELNALEETEVNATVGLYKRGGGNTARWSGQSDLLVEFHCNAYNTQATGTEVLYASGSEKGLAAALIMQNHLVKELELPDRGTKALTRRSRGGYLVWGVSQVALIPEPFFIDNDADLARAHTVDLAGAYTKAIVEILTRVV